MKQGNYVIGIDEVGRGALAGPVVVAAAMIPQNEKYLGAAPGTLKDSKKLSAKQREAWYAKFLEHPNITFAIARVYPRQIEKRNISGAANLAALRVYKKLVAAHRIARRKNNAVHIFLDGGLFLGSRAAQGKYQKAATLIKGDEKITAVACASIVAKVHRDGFMRKLAKRYPAYGFEVHKGYGTKLHLATLAKLGPCKAHRTTFLPLST